VSKDVADYYRRNPLMVSSPFGGVDGIDKDLLLEVFRQLDIDVAGRSILDVGCGRGYVGEVVEGVGGTYTGVDLVLTRGGVRMALADATALPFPDASFDGVLCIDAFEHVPGSERAAAEFRRVLRPRGFAFLSVPNYGNVAGLVKWHCERRGGYAENTWAPFRNWQPQEFELPLTAGKVKHAFEAAGFTKLRHIGYGPEVGLGLFPWIEHPNLHEGIKYRLQSLFKKLGPAVAKVWPGASLHHFWKMEV